MKELENILTEYLGTKKYKLALPKWISVEEQLPEDSRTVLVLINDTENPQWSGYKLGSYINEKWYCKGGRESHEIVTDWCQIPAKKKYNVCKYNR